MYTEIFKIFYDLKYFQKAARFNAILLILEKNLGFLKYFEKIMKLTVSMLFLLRFQ